MYEWRGNRVVTLHNFSPHPQQVKLQLQGAGSELVANLLIEHASRSRSGTHRWVIEEFGYRWYRVGGMSYALNRGRGLPQEQDPGA